MVWTWIPDLKTLTKHERNFQWNSATRTPEPFWRPICIASGAFLKLQQPCYRQFMVKGKRRTKKAFPGLVTPLFESCYKRCVDTNKRWVEISSSVSLNGVVPTGQTRNLVNLWGVHRPRNASIPPQPPYKIEWHRLWFWTPLHSSALKYV